MPKKARRLALKCVLSDKAQEHHLIIVNDLQMAAPKTKEMVTILGNLPVDHSVLIALPQVDANLLRSARNIPNVETTLAGSLNVVDLLQHDYVVVPVTAVRQIENQLASPTEE
jgi:large subunit ribosomal protein L4